MSFLIICLLTLFLPEILCSHDSCAVQQSCSPGGPAVRFPFQLAVMQPGSCGYNSSYSLRCDELNRTILELPSWPARVIVTKIWYESQMMQVQSPGTSFAEQLIYLDFDQTPFRVRFTIPWLNFPSLNSMYKFSLFNCSSSLDRHGSNRLVGIRTVSPLSNLLEMSMRSCTKMFDNKLIPTSLIDHMEDSVMNMSWSVPNCRRCEERHGLCGWKNASTNQFGCFGGTKHHSGTLKILYVSGSIIGCLLLLSPMGAIYFLYSKMEQRKEKHMRMKKFLENYASMKPTRYSFGDIKKITSNFKVRLGGGAYGNVFKGEISNEIFVAVKLLHNSIGNGDDFINEVRTMGKIHHVNVVRLLGFCADRDKKALIYEFLPNGSLDKLIFSNGQEHHTLGMGRIQNIAIGIARGIKYLHQGCEQRILHFDIKPHNILLDDNYNPKISVFGLAKLCEKGKSAVSMTAARGTMGYIAPEVFSRQFGNVSYKSDIYSFGMLLLEMVGRRKNIDTTVKNVSQVYFPEWLYETLVDGKDLIIEIEEDGDDEVAKRLAIVGLWCIQ